MKSLTKWALFLLSLTPQLGHAFCGFYVAKADASLFNQASQVVLVRDGDKTALTMFSDFKGEPSEFAIVIPVPEVLTREQINVGDRALIEHLDAYSAPRLVEYFDPDPCRPPDPMRYMSKGKADGASFGAAPATRPGGSHGVTIEAQYTVGEYDILILGAKESKGLENWLQENGYKMPKGASKALEPYVKQNLKFFVAKVNLKEQVKSGFKYLRPIQFAYESPRFMLPIRLGMVNSDGAQDMLVYAITPKGRVETTNYRTVKLPTGMDIPGYVKTDFANFYRSLFQTSHEKEGKKVVFLEYAWNMGWCDPCAADPLTNDELRKLGVFWLADGQATNAGGYKGRRSFVPPGGGGGAAQAFITRLHVRYDREHFPEDLMFQETSDSENFQGRFVLRQPWTGEMKCPGAETYRQTVRDRQSKEAETLASLTGWPIGEIRKKIGTLSTDKEGEAPKKWFNGIFK